MSNFSPSAHPRCPNGRFVTSAAREAAGVTLAEPPAQAVDRASRAAEEFLDYNEQLEIPDHSPGAEKHGTVELHMLADADTARGNCWAATNEIIELGASELEAEWLDELTMSGRGQHVAILAGYPEGHVVIDYTIRQFNPDLPFPWTGTVDDWKATVEESTGLPWEWEEDGEAA